jgi:hypothetical protein
VRRLCTLLVFALLTLPAVAGADELVTTTEKRTILMSEDYPVATSSTILKKLRGRLVGYGKLGKYNKIKIRIHLYEFSPKNGVRRRLEMRPQIGDRSGVVFIYRF